MLPYVGNRVQADRNNKKLRQDLVPRLHEGANVHNGYWGANQISFVMTDTQIISESFLEDINNLLNTGEIPNLMLPEDRDKIINAVRPIVIEMKKVDTIDVIN